MFQEVFCSQSNVFRYLTEKNGGEISRSMIRDGRLATIRVTELTMRSAVPNLVKAEAC